MVVVGLNFVAVGVMMCNLYQMQNSVEAGLVDEVVHHGVLKEW